jgi:outer membrane biosynthesis protein TonB
MPALSNTARHEYYVEIGNGLPPPVDPTHEYRQRRLTTAVETFNALRPGDAYEARLAVQIVLAGAHAADSLREAGLYRDDFAKMTRCRAQAASMMRELRAAKRMLAQEQKVRLATEAVANTAMAHPATTSGPSPQTEPQAAPPVQPPATASQPAAPQPAPIPPAVTPPRPATPHTEAQTRHDRSVTPQSKAHVPHPTPPTDPAATDGTSDLPGKASSQNLDAAA